MQIADSDIDPRPRVLGPSLVLDLDWAVHAATSAELRDKHPVLGELYGGDPGLADRVRGFWPDDPISCLPELDVLAHHAGALEEMDFDALRRALEEAAAEVPLEMRLASETPEDRAAILDRLRVLRSSAPRRAKWLDMLQLVWTGVADWWQADGAPAVVRAGTQLRADLARGLEWQNLVTTDCHTFAAHLPTIVQRQRAGDVELLLAPCALFGKGLYLDLPGSTLVGFGIARSDATARARTEAMARRLRAVADPTRLAILDHLGRGPSSVTDIARAFALAQPTVSSHVKHLREAGLVTSERRGTRLEVAVDRDALTALGSDIGTLLGT